MPPQADPNANPNLPVNILPAMDLVGGLNPFMPLQRQTTFRLKAGDKKAKTLKELTGSLTGQVLVSDALITLDDVLKAAGKTANGKAGGSLTLNSIDKKDNGDYHVAMRLENVPGQNPFGGVFGGNGVVIQNIQINGNVVMVGGGAPGGSGLPDLVDEKGNKYQTGGMTNRRMNVNNGQVSQEITLVYRAANNVGAPARLVLNGQRPVNFNIPFSFRNVELP
jgi:hypothetical protein